MDFVAYRTRSRARIASNRDAVHVANHAEGADLSLVEALLSASYDAVAREMHDESCDLDAALHDDRESYQAAMAGPDATCWRKSMIEEWNSILENQTFRAFEEDGILTAVGKPLPADLVTPLRSPAAGKPIGSKWVYKTKVNPNGSTRYKSRLVICGFQQVEGIDYGETYAPVSRLTSFQLLINLAACYGWAVDHLDVVTAFLNPRIDREHVYMHLPPGLEWLDPRFSQVEVVVLLKALYGLKQAP